MSEKQTQHAVSEYDRQLAISRLVSLQLTLLVLIRILQRPDQAYPKTEMENVLLKLSDCLDVVLNPISHESGLPDEATDSL